MPYTTCHMSISLDGFVAGPDQSREDPLGKRGKELHDWHLGDERANDSDATAERRLMSLSLVVVAIATSESPV